DDALAPVLDAAEAGAGARHLLLGVAPVPHPVVVPDVAERVEMRRHVAVVDEPVVVDGAAPARAGHRADPVLRRHRVPRAGAYGHIAAQGDDAAAADESRR